MCQRKTLVPPLLHPAYYRRDTDIQGQAPCAQTHILEYVRSDCQPTPGEPRTLAGMMGPNGVCCVRDLLIPDSFKDIVHKKSNVLSIFEKILMDTKYQGIFLYSTEKKLLNLILVYNIMCYVIFKTYTYPWLIQASGAIRDSSILLCLNTTMLRFLLWLKAPSGISSIKLFSRCSS